MDKMTLTLNSPLTDEQWDAITDVDFDNINEIYFNTKHGKEVYFVKRKKGKWIKTGQSFVNPNKFLGYSCSCCGFHVRKENPLFLFCPSCGAEMRVKE